MSLTTAFSTNPRGTTAPLLRNKQGISHTSEADQSPAAEATADNSDAFQYVESEFPVLGQIIKSMAPVLTNWSAVATSGRAAESAQPIQRIASSKSATSTESEENVLPIASTSPTSDAQDDASSVGSSWASVGSMADWEKV